MRKFLTKIVVALAVALSATAAYADNFKDQAIDTVVQLNRNCSGVVFDTSNTTTTYIITANHCVSDGASPDPKNTSGYVSIDKKERGKLLGTDQHVYDVLIRDTANDLAVIKLREEGLMLPSASIANTDPYEGEKVWTVGYPLGLTRTITEGFMGGYESINRQSMSGDQFGNEAILYRATPAIFGGNSGGGLFKKNGENYELVGITDLGFRIFPVAGYYVPQDKINEIIARALKNEAKTETVQIVQRKAND